jgi:hypothetical protein
MKKVVIALVLFALIIRPVYASYAEELTNEGETYKDIVNISYEGRDYILYGIYQDNQLKLIVLQDTLNNLITDNETIKNVFYQYRLKTIETAEGETIENPKYMSEKDFTSFVDRIQQKYDFTQNKINDLENLFPSFEKSIFNLSFQGAQFSKSIKLFSELQDSTWEAKLLFYRNKFNSANKQLEDLKHLISKLTIDIATSLKIEEGNSALRDVLSLINDAKKEGYDIKNIENDFDSANTLLFEAKDNYMNENYDVVNSEIDSILKTAEKIVKDIQQIKSSKPTPETVQNVPVITTPPATGLMIQNYTGLLSFFAGIAIIAIVIVIFYKRRTSKFIYHYKSRRFF